MSDREFRYRISEHVSYVRNKVQSIATGYHFNLPDMKFTIIEQVRNIMEHYRREGEKFFIIKFNTFYDGIMRTI